MDTLVPTFDRAAALTRSNEQVSEDREMQAKAAEKKGHLVTDSPAIAHFKASAALRLRDGVLGGDRLAEAHFWAGNFALAAQYAENDAKKAECIEFAKAIETLSSECPHEKIQTRGGNTAKGVSIPAKREIQRVYVEKLGQEVKFIRCEECKNLFAEFA